MDCIDFGKVLTVFESNGWQLKKTWGNYRVFINPDDPEELPWLIPVHDRKVSVEYYEKIQRFFEKMSRKIPENLEQPFDKAVLAEARKIAGSYRVLLEKHERLGYIGSSVEMPTVFVDAKTPQACYKATEEALTVAVATMLECGRTPPQGAAKRTEQVNVRLTPYEKLVLTAKAGELGFKGISDLIRNAIIRNLLKAS